MKRKNTPIKIMASILSLIASIALFSPISAWAKMYTNQSLIESFSSYDDLDEKKIDQVFMTVLSDTSKTITIYPTEGYYYFWFYQHGNLIRGNMRFSYDLIDNNQLSFAYYYDIEGKGGRNSKTYHKIYSQNEGLNLTKVTDKQYRLTYQGIEKHIYFDIPVSNYQPLLSEVFLGDMRDESGIVFSLVFNKENKHFYYFLDQSKNYEYYYKLAKNISVGARTGFVYYTLRDDEQVRKVLIGVSEENTHKNNFLDGPFDQLPDHYLGKTRFKDFLEQAYPDTKGKIDSHGQYLNDSSSRVAIDNYVHYADLNQFKTLTLCDGTIDCVQQFIDLLEDGE